MITEQQIKQACLDSIRHWEWDILWELSNADKIKEYNINNKNCFNLIMKDCSVSSDIYYNCDHCKLCYLFNINCTSLKDLKCPLFKMEKLCKDTPWFMFQVEIMNKNLDQAIKQCRNMIEHMKSRFNELGYL